MAQWSVRSTLETDNLSESDKLVLERYVVFRRNTMPGSSPKQQFDAAVQLIRGLPKDGPFQPSNEMKLRLYGFFKQATEGPCTQPAPSFWDVIGKAKWGAWKNLGDMPAEKAMTSYVEEIKKVMETMSLTDDVANLMDTLGPVYEYVDDDSSTRPPRKKHVRFSPDSDPPATNGHGGGGGHAPPAAEEAAANGAAPTSGEEGQGERREEEREHPAERWTGSVTSDTDEDEEFNDPVGEVDGAAASGRRDATEARLDALHRQLTALTRLVDAAGAQMTPASADGRSLLNGSPAVSAAAAAAGRGPAGDGRALAAAPTTCPGVHDELRALVRDMRDDLDTVTGRLRSLEAAQRTSSTRDKTAVRPWWQVPELSAGSVLVLLAWPLVLQLVLRLVTSRRARR